MVWYCLGNLLKMYQSFASQKKYFWQKWRTMDHFRKSRWRTSNWTVWILGLQLTNILLHYKLPNLSVIFLINRLVYKTTEHVGKCPSQFFPRARGDDIKCVWSKPKDIQFTQKTNKQTEKAANLIFEKLKLSNVLAFLLEIWFKRLIVLPSHV